MEQGRDEPGEDDPQDAIRPMMPMIIFPGQGRSKIARLGGTVSDIAKLLALPILALILNIFWETIGLGIEWVLATLGLQVGIVLIVLSLPTPTVHVIREVRRIQRLRRLTSNVNPKLTLGELRELKMCRGSGRSALKMKHWKEDECQHCLATPDLVGDRIGDHLVPLVHIDLVPVECDPRLVAIWHRRCSRDQRPPPRPWQQERIGGLAGGPTRPADPSPDGERLAPLLAG